MDWTWDANSGHGNLVSLVPANHYRDNQVPGETENDNAFPGALRKPPPLEAGGFQE